MYELPKKCAALPPCEGEKRVHRIHLEGIDSFLPPVDNDREAMIEAAAAAPLHIAPDPAAAALCAAFAENLGVEPDGIAAGNGVAALVSLIERTFLSPGETVLFLDYDSEDYRAALPDGCATVVCPKRDDLIVDPDAVIDALRASGARMLILSNPCVITGEGLPRDAMRRIIDAADAAGALVVADESAMDLWDQSLVTDAAARDNLIVLRTAGGIVGLSALCLGCAVTCPRLAALLRAAGASRDIDAVAAAMAAVVLKNPLYPLVYPDLLVASREMLTEGLRPLHDEGRLRLCESRTGFVFFRVPGAYAMYEDLEDRGILVKPVGADGLRIAGGTQAQNRELLAILHFLVTGQGGCYHEEENY